MDCWDRNFEKVPYLTGGAVRKGTVLILINFLSEVIFWLFFRLLLSDGLCLSSAL